MTAPEHASADRSMNGTNASCAAVADLLAGAAVDALSPEERLAVASHVADCPPCREELDAMRETAALLGTAVPVAAPPPRAREALLATARQQRPAARPPRPALLRAPFRISPAWGAAAAAVLVAFASVVWAASLQNRVAALEAQAATQRQKAERYDAIVSVLGSRQLAVRELEPSGNGVQASGTVYLDPASQRGMVMLHDLPPAGPGRAFQLWYVRGNQRVSGGMLWPDAQGTVYAVITVPADLGDFQSVGVTEEPGTGSPAPTSPRVVGTSLQ